MKTMRFSQVSTVSLLFAGAISATALAMGVLDPATKEEGFAYVDADYLGGGALVSAVRRSAGSGSERYFEIQVKLPAGAGSLTEDAHFSGQIDGTASLPAEILLRPTNDKFEEVSNETAGALEVDQFDRSLLKGELFGYDLEALPRRAD